MEDMFDRGLIAKQMLQKINVYCQEKFDDGHRSHLGASLIGHECARYLWYTFRWCQHTVHSGTLYRLFQRGHREEVYLVEYLTAIGCKISEFQEDGVTQHRISDCEGHFGGSLDGRGYLPPEFNYNEEVLFEFKTINQKGHSKLETEGMPKNKPQHFGQTSTYGYKNGFKYCCYVSVNKNTDEIYLELVELDWEVGKECLRKAEYVINAPTPPQKLSQTSTFWKCKFCDMASICHHDRDIDKNCRSCANAEPVANGEWQCSVHGIIPKEYLANGCEENWVGVQ